MIDPIFFACLLLPLVAIGARKAQKIQKEETYLFADRSTSFLSLSSTLVMTEFNPSTLISFASLGYLAGMRALLLPLVFLIGLLFYGITVAKKYKQSDAASVCFLFREKYGKNFSRISCIFLLLAMIGFSATYVKSLSLIFSPLVPQVSHWIISALVVGLTLWMTLRGGLVSIIRTDLGSFLLTFILIPALFFFTSSSSSQLEPKHFANTEQILNTPFILSLIVLTMFTYILAPWYGQKIFSAKSEKVAFTSVLFSAFCVFLLYGLIVIAAAFLKTTLDLAHPEKALPSLIQRSPLGWKGALYAFLFLAGATTLSGVWNAMTSLFIAEFCTRSDEQDFHRSYWTTLTFSMVSFLLAHIFVDSVFDKLILANIPVLALSFSLLAGFYWKGSRTTGAYLSALTGFFWGIFCYGYWGEDRIYIWYWVMGGIPLIFITGILGSLWETGKVTLVNVDES